MSQKVDWQSQWALHCPYYRDGYLFVNLQEFSGPNSVLRLKPGPGFGDLSHPTTRLVLKMMLPLVQNQIVLDVGCGSGILALAAAKTGAKAVYAYDIDQDALAHGRENETLNGLKVIWRAPQHLPAGSMAVMNMIRSEQAQAFKSLQPLHSHITTWITSGVLEEEKELYLEEAKKRGWLFQEYFAEQGWLAFRFTRSF